MSLALVIGDPGNHTGEPITSGSSRTIIAGSGAAHIGSSVATHTIPGPETHGGVTLVGSGNNNRTIIAGTPGCSAGATGSCGDSFSAAHTTRTTIS